MSEQATYIGDGVMTDEEVLKLSHKLRDEIMELHPDWYDVNDKPPFAYSFDQLRRELGPSATLDDLVKFSTRLQDVARNGAATRRIRAE